MSQEGAQRERRLRNLRKKLAEIAALEQKLVDGHPDISPEQYAKLQRRTELEEELHDLEHCLGLEEEAEGEHPELPSYDEVHRAAVLAQQPDECFVHSQRWEEDPVSVEDVIPVTEPEADQEPDVETLEAVQPFSAAVQACPRLLSLVQAVSELSLDAFDEDALHMVTRKSGWKLTLLALPAGSEHALVGFVVYRLRPELQSVSIAKLAVVPEHRRHGYGCRLIDWCVRLAKRQPGISFISLSSLPEAVRFYQRLGFKKFDVGFDKREPEDDLVEGQVYMEKPIKGRGGRKVGKGRR